MTSCYTRPQLAYADQPGRGNTNAYVTGPRAMALVQRHGQKNCGRRDDERMMTT